MPLQPLQSSPRPSQTELLERVLVGLSEQLDKRTTGTWGSTAYWLLHAQKKLIWGERYRNIQPRTQNTELHQSVVKRLNSLTKSWQKRFKQLAQQITGTGSQPQKAAVNAIKVHLRISSNLTDTRLGVLLERLVNSLRVQIKPQTLPPGRIAKPGWQRDTGRQPEHAVFVTSPNSRRFRN